jgi:predicted RNA-binding Zn-ribbon protein involved in translation (DUF1610 family)
MSDNLASDWLLHGIAAARAHEKEEARSLLERALIELDVMSEAYGENDTNAREDAWYWLSTVSDDPKQKREYLENVLASNPGYPEARRDLAILEGRLKPDQIVNPERAAGPVLSDTRPDSSEVRRYVCPQCGGKLTFSVARHALACEYCGFLVAEADAGAVVGHDFTAAIYTASAHRWELPVQRVLACQSCGAHVVVPPANVTSTCPFCGSAHIVAANASADLIEPGGVIPFQIDQDTAIQRVRDWLATQHLNKDDLKHAAFARPRPVYYPFWSFNMGGELRWQGLVEEITTTSAGRMTTVWLQRDGSELVMDDNLLVPASHTLPNDLTTALAAHDPRGVAKVPGYRLDALLPYSDSYLADWPAELYQISLADASLAAHQRAFESAREHMRQSVAVRDPSFDSTGIIINTYKLVLLPVWLCELKYKDKPYPLAINGQSGAVHGRLPENPLRKFVSGLLG